MEIATNFVAVKFRVTHGWSMGQPITAHPNTKAWLQQLSKLSWGWSNHINLSFVHLKKK